MSESIYLPEKVPYDPDNYLPFVYLLIFLPLDDTAVDYGRQYYGSMYRNSKSRGTAHPDWFFIEDGYWTSSPIIHEKLREYGPESFVVVIMNTFEIGQSAYDHETDLLLEQNASRNSNFFNTHNNNQSFNIDPMDMNNYLQKRRETLDARTLEEKKEIGKTIKAGKEKKWGRRIVTVDDLYEYESEIRELHNKGLVQSKILKILTEKYPELEELRSTNLSRFCSRKLKLTSNKQDAPLGKDSYKSKKARESSVLWQEPYRSEILECRKANCRLIGKRNGSGLIKQMMVEKYPELDYLPTHRFKTIYVYEEKIGFEAS